MANAEYLIDKVIEGKLKTEELLLVPNLISIIKEMHGALMTEIERLSVVSVLPNKPDEDAVEFVIRLPRVDVERCKLGSQIKTLLINKTLEGFAERYKQETDYGAIRKNVQRVETGRDNEEAPATPVDPA